MPTQTPDTLLQVTDTTQLDTIMTIGADRLQDNLFVSASQHESWLFALLLGLFIFLILALQRSTGWIADTMKNFFVKRSRSGLFFRSAAHDFQSRLLLSLFSTGVIVLFLYISMNQKTVFEITRFLLMFGFGIIFLIIKYTLFNLISYTFLNEDDKIMIREAYFSIYSLLGVLLFPLLVINIYLPIENHSTFFVIIALIISGLAFITMLIKVFQIFYTKLLDIFYIMLYLCTLEILPLIGMYQAYKLIVTGYIY